MSIYIAQVGIVVGREISSAEKRQSVTSTAFWTHQVAHQLIIVLWTLKHAVTHVLGVDTHPGVTAPVEPRTPVAVTRCLVLAIRTVIDTVAAHVDWHAVVATWTQEVCFGTNVAGRRGIEILGF